MLSKQSSDIAIHSSCYSSETEDSLKCAKGVWCIIEKTNVIVINKNRLQNQL